MGAGAGAFAQPRGVEWIASPPGFRRGLLDRGAVPGAMGRTAQLQKPLAAARG
jgi:hypothetical protein